MLVYSRELCRTQSYIPNIQDPDHTTIAVLLTTKETENVDLKRLHRKTGAVVDNPGITRGSLHTLVGGSCYAFGSAEVNPQGNNGLSLS